MQKERSRCLLSPVTPETWTDHQGILILVASFLHFLEFYLFIFDCVGSFAAAQSFLSLQRSGLLFIAEPGLLFLWWRLVEHGLLDVRLQWLRVLGSCGFRGLEPRFSRSCGT